MLTCGFGAVKERKGEKRGSLPGAVREPVALIRFDFVQVRRSRPRERGLTNEEERP